MRTLRLGSRGDDVRAWQAFLNVPVTGQFDEATKSATEKFQKNNELKDDGVAGSKTMEKAVAAGFKDTEQSEGELPDSGSAAVGEFHLSASSLRKLEGVKEPLVRVVKRAIEITTIDFTVLEGLRTLERQKMLLARGSSKTLRSRHLTGDAVDIAPIENGRVSWDWPLYDRLAVIVKAAAEDVDVVVEWGGDWKTFKDGPHWQLPWR